jgi:hypothetical protein
MLDKRHLPALKFARYCIEQGAQRYICYALDAVAQTGTADLAYRCHEVKKYIHGNLDGRSLLSTWISDRLFTRDNLANSAAYMADYYSETGVFTLARLAWLDRMIADLEEAQ